MVERRDRDIGVMAMPKACGGCCISISFIFISIAIAYDILSNGDTWWFVKEPSNVSNARCGWRKYKYKIEEMRESSNATVEEFQSTYADMCDEEEPKRRFDANRACKTKTLGELWLSFNIATISFQIFAIPFICITSHRLFPLNPNMLFLVLWGLSIITSYLAWVPWVIPNANALCYDDSFKGEHSKDDYSWKAGISIFLAALSSALSTLGWLCIAPVVCLDWNIWTERRNEALRVRIQRQNFAARSPQRFPNIDPPEEQSQEDMQGGYVSPEYGVNSAVSAGEEDRLVETTPRYDVRV